MGKYRKIIFRLLEFYGTRIRHPGQWWIHSWLLKVFKLKVDKELVVKRGMRTWILNPNNYVEADVFWYGVKDKWELYHAKNMVPAEGVFFDVGANFGYYSCVLGSDFKQKYRIYAFEPSPDNFVKLQKHITSNSLSHGVHAYQLGLSDSMGYSSMIGNDLNSGAAYLSGNSGNIKVTTLDAFCSQEKVGTLDFIKIDVEGYEIAVLRGGRDTIKMYKPILLIELNPLTLRRNGLSIQDAANLLKEYGYSLFVIKRKKLQFLAKLPSDDGYFNVICLHQEAHKRFFVQ